VSRVGSVAGTLRPAVFHAQFLIPCKKQLNEDLNSKNERNKKKIRAKGTAHERNLKSSMFYIHFTWAENENREWRGDLLDRDIDYTSRL
jgi:hypothetical protein